MKLIDHMLRLAADEADDDFDDSYDRPVDGYSTSWKPGTDMKIIIMATRVLMNLQPHHPQDWSFA